MKLLNPLDLREGKEEGMEQAELPAACEYRCGPRSYRDMRLEPPHPSPEGIDTPEAAEACEEPPQRRSRLYRLFIGPRQDTLK
jgi:hypothetical protein